MNRHHLVEIAVAVGEESFVVMWFCGLVVGIAGITTVSAMHGAWRLEAFC